MAAKAKKKSSKRELPEAFKQNQERMKAGEIGRKKKSSRSATKKKSAAKRKK